MCSVQQQGAYFLLFLRFPILNQHLQSKGIKLCIWHCELSRDYQCKKLDISWMMFTWIAPHNSVASVISWRLFVMPSKHQMRKLNHLGYCVD
jgi:hypothetical protein